ATLCFAAQSAGERVEHVGETAARLERHLTKREQPRGIEKPCCLISSWLSGTDRCCRKELANAPFRRCNSLCQFNFVADSERLLCESCHVTVGDSCHTNEHNTRQNRRKQSARVGGREYDHRVGRRLLERLEERVGRDFRPQLRNQSFRIAHNEHFATAHRGRQ